MSRATSEQTTRLEATPGGGFAQPCALHPGSPIRRDRTHGLLGPGVYLQCVPQDGDTAHLLAWPEEGNPVSDPSRVTLTAVEIEILTDAADGLTTVESATKRAKSSETAKTQRKKLLIKLNARNMTQAVAVAARERLLPSPLGHR